MENSNDIDKIRKLDDCRKTEKENLLRSIEAAEKTKESRKLIRKLELSIEKEQHENEKLLEKNEKLNKKRLDNDETYTWGELILRENSFVTVEETKEIWVYSKKLGYYVPNGEMYLLKLCADGGPRTNDTTVLNQIRMFIKGKTGKPLDEFVHPEHLINLKNGVLDMNKNELLPKSSEYYFQNSLNIIYNKNADCPIWKKTIREMFVHEEDYIRTQKWFGYHLLSENKDQVMHGFVGPSGCGKSTMLHTLVDLLGKENVTHFNLQDLNNRTNAYAIGRLYGKLANITFDMITTPIKDGMFELIKNLTSCDRINARNIREAPFEFIPRVKLTFACNKLPNVADNILYTSEFKRRLMITEVIKKKNFVKDLELKNKFLEELHKGGIFNWVLEGRKLYIEEKGFNYNHENIPIVWKVHIDDQYNGIDFDKVKTSIDDINETKDILIKYNNQMKEKLRKEQEALKV